jgi:hypothetical protein
MRTRKSAEGLQDVVGAYVLDTLYKDTICQDKFMQMFCFEKEKKRYFNSVEI